jgi:ubiquinone/menaquinone biosynthesis C-methylase UbiE
MNIGTGFMDPRVVISHFHLHPGDTVADFGTGTGHYLKALSEAVGSKGSLYACEIQKGLVEQITKRIATERLANVHAIWCDLERSGGIKLKDGLLDAGILMNTLFIIDDRVGALAEMHRVIRKGGNLYVVDWTDSFRGLGPHPSQVITEDMTRTLLQSNGFAFERSFPAADHHYGVAFKRV